MYTCDFTTTTINMDIHQYQHPNNYHHDTKTLCYDPYKGQISQYAIRHFMQHRGQQQDHNQTTRPRRSWVQEL